MTDDAVTPSLADSLNGPWSLVTRRSSLVAVAVAVAVVDADADADGMMLTARLPPGTHGKTSAL
jgi:hypothetical protein